MRVSEVEQEQVWVTRRIRTGRVHLDRCPSVQTVKSSRRVNTSVLSDDQLVCRRCSGEFNPREDLGGGDNSLHRALEAADPAQYP